MDENRVNGALSGRIAAGKADPISGQERTMVSGMRRDFERKYGRSATGAESVRITSNSQTERVTIHSKSSKKTTRFK